MNNTMLRTTESATSDAEEPGSSISGEVPPERIGPARPTPDANTTIEVDPGDLEAAAVARLVQGVTDVVPHLDRMVASIGLRIVNDEAMTRLHAQWKGAVTTTDVVTFDLTASATSPLIVEIAICLDEAQRQAATRHHAVEDELLLYVIHGLLHCCGHDDHSELSSRRMHHREDTLLRAIGRGAIFDRPEHGS